MTTRRVLTGKNAEGKSYYLHGGPTPAIAQALADNAARFDTGGVMEEDRTGMHTTRTIDCGSEPCTMAFVLIGSPSYG